MSSVRSRKRTPGKKDAETQEPILAVDLIRKRRSVTVGDMSVTSTEHRLPRKRARVEPENISSPRSKPYRSKKGISVIKPRKAVPSRVQKTYRNRQKMELSSPGHNVNRDVDYDEIPPSTTILNSPMTKKSTSPSKRTSDCMSTSRVLQTKRNNGRAILLGLPTVEPEPVDEILNNTKREKNVEPNQTDSCLILPTAVVADDDDPIRSFSSSPSELLCLTGDPVSIFDMSPSA